MGCESPGWAMYYGSPGSKPRCLIGPGHPVDHVPHVGSLAASNVSNSYIIFCKAPDLVLPRSEGGWNSAITAPSNSEPRLVLTVAGKKLLDAAGLHCGGEEGVPHNGFAGVGSNEIKLEL